MPPGRHGRVHFTLLGKRVTIAVGACSTWLKVKEGKTLRDDLVYQPRFRAALKWTLLRVRKTQHGAWLQNAPCIEGHTASGASVAFADIPERMEAHLAEHRSQRVVENPDVRVDDDVAQSVRGEQRPQRRRRRAHRAQQRWGRGRHRR